MTSRFRTPSERTLERLDDEFETVAPRSGGGARTRAASEHQPDDAPEAPVYTRSSELRAAKAERTARRRADREARQDGGAVDAAAADAAAADAAAPGGAGPDASARTARRGPSLKMRAVGYLSRREYSRQDLARKLAPHAESEEEVAQVLEALTREGWQSNERYAQSLAHRRAPRQGTARIVQELKHSGIDDVQIAEVRDTLRATEYERALEVWRKRFGEAPADRAAYAKQVRFLASRGFAHDAIRRVIGSAGAEDEF
ncbi:recombination regulator RecX [Bordetella genomosp. 1]|uniref:Regulatory protein RecX n=1 Tax=Bordetella genomosp. 1 TaxID=1395607 RepID=A0ABX4EUC4_9BORD|nr:recombination regulator RecX [Bordetella genomosp. 1]OZI57823.1 recombination regulator RecX [Bordetella genomosp. 1]